MKVETKMKRSRLGKRDKVAVGYLLIPPIYDPESDCEKKLDPMMVYLVLVC